MGIPNHQQKLSSSASNSNASRKKRAKGSKGQSDRLRGKKSRSKKNAEPRVREKLGGASPTSKPRNGSANAVRKKSETSDSSSKRGRTKKPNTSSSKRAAPKSNGLPYRYGPSPINGKGVFATRAIAKGERIGEYMGPEASRNGKYVLWVEDEDEVYARSGRNGLRYLNHSRKPNAEFDGFELFSIKRIEAGTEITFDYGDRELSFY